MAAADSERTVMLQASAKRRHSYTASESSAVKRSRSSSLTLSNLDGNGGSTELHWQRSHHICSVQSDDTESYHSFQGYETALVKDSSDDLWFLDDDDSLLAISSPRQYVRQHSVDGHLREPAHEDELDEFEVLSESSESDLSEASTVNFDEIASADEIFVLCDDSSSDGWADFSSLGKNSDGSTEECDSDSGSFQKDKWYCGKCNHMNPPLRGYCEQCWDARPGWLPEPAAALGRKQSRQQRRQQQQKQRRPRSAPAPTRDELVTNERHCHSDPVEGRSTCENGGPVAAVTRQRDGCVAECSETTRVAVEHPHSDSQSTSCSSSSSSTSSSSDDDEVGDLEAVIRLPAHRRQHRLKLSSAVSSGSSAAPAAVTAVPATQRFRLCPIDHTDELCVICSSRKKNACIIHGSTGHQVCCYPCARKMQFRMRPCPVCRRPIQKVIRNYFISSC